MVSRIKGYDCILAVSSKSSADKIDMLKFMGKSLCMPANSRRRSNLSYYEVAKRLHEELTTVFISVL
jgi:cystathionine beta-synthase